MSDASGLMSIVSVCAACVVFACLIVVVYSSWSSNRTKVPSGTPASKAGCKKKQGDCAYTTRQLIEGQWVCPMGYEDTGCDWKDGAEKGKLQCRACGVNSPYFAYGLANPNCPTGFIPCNDPKFNYGDLKKNSKGEYSYADGWGVDDPGYEWDVFGADYLGGSISLNKGKWGGTDAHPEVFAKGCCAFGNSTDDPQRDKANKSIKIASAIVSGIVDAASIIAIPFTGGLSMTASLALHAASVGVSVGAGQAGSLIKAKCGGPTVKYKEGKTKGRNYLYKGPYNDVGHGMESTKRNMRGSLGLWYQANNGCPLKWLQYQAQVAPTQ